MENEVAGNIGVIGWALRAGFVGFMLWFFAYALYSHLKSARAVKRVLEITEPDWMRAERLAAEADRRAARDRRIARDAIRRAR